MRQFGRTITEYELELRKLAKFVLEFANSKEYLYSKFEKGLRLEIREKMSVLGSQSYKKVVQLALKAKKLTGEKRSQDSFLEKKKKGNWFHIWIIIKEKL